MSEDRSRALPPAGETPDEWWARVRAEHGPPPQALRDFYQGVVSRERTRVAAEQRAAAAPVVPEGRRGSRGAS